MKNFRYGVAKLTTTRPTFIAMKVSYAVSLTLIGQVVRRGHQGAEIILPKVYYLTAELSPTGTAHIVKHAVTPANFKTTQQEHA